MPDLIFERANPDVLAAISTANTFIELAKVFADALGMPADQIPGQEPPKTPSEYKADKSDFGLKLRGIKTRENLNNMAREILSRVHDPADLTEEDAQVLKQYSGRGGLTENSQFEYYTPTPIAQGVWDILKEHGFQNGNVLDPCVGAGVFPATKPEGVVMTGTDIDPVASKIAGLFNPEDAIKTGAFEAIATSAPDDHFDSVVGNVPFGDARGKSIHDDPPYKDEKRIERYFIQRALDKLKPGGLACLVVPINIVGAKSDRWKRFRIAISKKAEFLGAHKLPSKSFGAQGTDTVVDIIVLKKHPRDLLDRIYNIAFETLKTAQVVWDEFVEGRYWMGEGRKFIQGKYVPKIDGDRWSREVVDGDIDPMAIRQKLARRFNSRIDWDAIDAAPEQVPSYVDGDQRIINGRQYEFLNGEWIPVIEKQDPAMTIDPNVYGVATMEELRAILSTPGGPLALTAENMFAIYKAWPDLLMSLHKDAVEFAMSQAKDSLREQAFRGTIVGGLIGRLRADGDESERSRLQALVVSEIDRYGHPKHNNAFRLTGATSRAFGLYMNALDEKGTFSDLLAGTLEKDQLEFDSTNVQSIVEHLYVREGVHAIELADIQKLYTGGMKINSLGDLAQIDNIAITPDGMIMPIGRFTSGDVYPKITAMTDAMADEPDDRLKAKWQQQIDMIMARVHMTNPEDITFGLQDKWYPKGYLLAFLRENGYPNAKFGRFDKVPVEDPVTGQMTERTRFVEDLDNPFGRFVGVSPPNKGGFQRQFEKFLNGEKITSSDAEKIEAYKNEAAAIAEAFNAWMQQHTDMDQLAAMYNRKFNGYVPYQYEETPLKIEGLADEITLRGFQNSGVRRLSEEGGGILGDDVGLGKTFSAIALHFYNKQMGRTKKTCISVPDSVLNNWYHEVSKLTKNMDDVLFVGLEPKLNKDGTVLMEPVLDEQGNPKLGKNGQPLQQAVLLRRKSAEDIWKKMWEIPTTNKSLVVMTKENFGKIPMRSETKGAYAAKMAERALISDKLAASLAAAEKGAKGEGAEKKVSYDQDKDRLRAEARYADEGTAKKGELPYFEDMGFTNLIVDEAHEFKNSYQAGKQSQNIAYLPTAPSSQRAIDMTMKTSYLREANNGRGVYPLTATPVTNSPFEVFNMLSYVAPLEEFERFGVYTVDDFVRVFGKIKPVDKVMVSGDIKTKDGLVGFQNLDGLRNLFHKYVLLRDAEDVALELPPHEELNQEVTLTDDQESIYADLKEDAKEAASPGSKIKMFAVIRDMDRITTDMDLYNHTMTFTFKLSDKDKVDRLVTELPKRVTVTETDEDGKPVKYSVDVKNELSVEGNTYKLVTHEQVEEHVASKMARLGIDENDVTHPLMPKYAKLVENLRAHLEANGKQIVFTEEKTQHRKIKRILSHHIPLSRDLIAIINADEAAGTKLQSISDQYNSGAVKVVIANKKAEVGVNLQKGTTAIHHLTLPWTPASIKQRNGRGVRQGNTAANIKIYYYLGKGSFDFYRLDLLRRKSSWMKDLFNGTDVEAENANAISQDDMLDMLADNPEEAKRRRMERLAKLNAERDAREKKRMLNMLQQLANVTESLSTLDADKETRRTQLTEKIAKLEKTIANQKEKGLTLEPGDPERAKLGERLITNKVALDTAQKALAGLDEAFERRKADLESKRKQSQNILRTKGKKGELPFDPSLVDHPENSLSTFDGRLFAVGDMFEIKTDYSQVVFKLTGVVREERGFTYDVLSGRGYDVNGTYSHAAGGRIIKLDDFPKDAVQVHYSEKELALQKLLDNTFSYEKLIGEIDKETFLENLDKVKLSGDLFVRAAGGYAFEQSWDLEDISAVVFPEPANADYRKHLAETYLSLRREDGYVSSGIMRIVRAVFGDQMESAIAQYGTQATEMQIREFYADFVNQHLDENLPNGANEPDPAKILGQLNSLRYNLNAAAQKLGDNVEFIKKTIEDCFNAQREVVTQKVAAAAAAAEREAAEQLKQHPDYKEIPEDVRDAFARIGLTIKINSARAVLPGRRVGRYKRYRDTELPPFARWFLQDKHGKQGVLYRVKEILKSRFDAQFFSGDSGEFSGAWWHVPSSTPLDDLFKVLA